MDEKKIDDMDYDELNKVKEEEEQIIDEMEDSIKEHQNILSYVIERINKLDGQED